MRGYDSMAGFETTWPCGIIGTHGIAQRTILKRQEREITCVVWGSAVSRFGESGKERYIRYEIMVCCGGINCTHSSQ
jgi:hypothetical protein